MKRNIKLSTLNAYSVERDEDCCSKATIIHKEQQYHQKLQKPYLLSREKIFSSEIPQVSH